MATLLTSNRLQEMTVDTPKHFNIFYSWQSDIDKKANNHFIKDCIERAIKELKKEDDITVIPRLDKDTQGTTGSPKITETILGKIDASHLFISDITIINSNWFNKILNRRLTPNPNVLFELGYALYRLTWGRIICLNNDSFSNIADMPFDLQQNRIAQYNFNGKDNKEEARKQLTDLLKVAIKSIIDNNEVLLAKDHQRNIHQHDIKVFQGLDAIMDDSTFLDLLQNIANIQIVIKHEYRLLDTFTEYLKAEKNQFIIPELIESAKELHDAVSKMHITLATTLQSKYETWFDETEKEAKEQISYHLPQNEGYFKTYQEYEANRDDRIDRNKNAIFAAMESYKKFRSTIKRHLFI